MAVCFIRRLRFMQWRYWIHFRHVTARKWHIKLRNIALKKSRTASSHWFFSSLLSFQRIVWCWLLLFRWREFRTIFFLVSLFTDTRTCPYMVHLLSSWQGGMNVFLRTFVKVNRYVKTSNVYVKPRVNITNNKI